MEGGGEGEIERVENSKDLQQQSKAFDKLTDRVEDRQLDSTRVQEAMASIAASSEADWNAMRLRSLFRFTLFFFFSFYQKFQFRVNLIEFELHMRLKHNFFVMKFA